MQCYWRGDGVPLIFWEVWAVPSPTSGSLYCCSLACVKGKQSRIPIRQVPLLVFSFKLEAMHGWVDRPIAKWSLCCCFLNGLAMRGLFATAQ